MIANLDVSQVADNVELRVWANKSGIPMDSIKEEIKTLIPDEEDTDEIDDELFEFVTEVFDEFGYRKKYLGDNYPFDLTAQRLDIADTLLQYATTYLFCLGLSRLEPEKINQSRAIRSIEFEMVALSATKAYFNAEGVRTGAPWRTNTLQNYYDVLNQICSFVPEVKAPQKDIMAPRGGDGGWDFVVGKSFPDQHFPQLIAIGNCATGENFLQKGEDLTADHFFSKFLGRVRSPIIEVMAVPFILTEEHKSMKANSRRILFDRLRLALHCPTAGTDAVSWLNLVQPQILKRTLV